MRLTFSSATTLALLLATTTAAAQDGAAPSWFSPEEQAPQAPLPPPPPGFTPLPPGAPLPPNIVKHPDGTATVTRTPEGGVDVHAQTSSGTVHAYDCSRVDADPTTRSSTPAGPCPYPHVSPYPYAPSGYALPGYGPPNQPLAPLNLNKKRPKWAPDPGRRNMLIVSSLTFGLGTMLTGTAFVVSALGDAICDGGRTCGMNTSKAALYGLGTVLTVPASLPRFYMGDTGTGLLYTALRGASFLAGALIDFDDPTYLVPISLAFIAPLTLGIIDLATTPHREQMEARERLRASKFQLLGIGPTVARDMRGAPMPAFGVVGAF